MNNKDKLASAIDRCNQAIDAAMAALSDQRSNIIELKKPPRKRAGGK